MFFKSFISEKTSFLASKLQNKKLQKKVKAQQTEDLNEADKLGTLQYLEEKKNTFL